MVGPLIVKGDKVEGFLRPGDDRDIFVTQWELEKVHTVGVKQFYKALKAELDADGWVDPDDGGSNFETLSWQRINANGARDEHVWWRMIKHPNGPGFDYMRWAMKLDFATINSNKSEIAYKGKKTKVEFVDIVVRCWFWVQWDYKDKFKNSIVASLKKKFLRKLFKAEMDQQWSDVMSYSIKFHTFVKTSLDMETSGEKKHTFHPESGYKDQFAP